MSNRVRVVQGSCWPCKKRRVKCDLTKPVCQRCILAGATCDYNTRLIRWSQRPITSIPAVHQTLSCRDLPTLSLDVYERRALDYFHGRVWPLLSTSSEPSAPPTPVALENRVVLLAICLLADSHRLLQDGKGSPDKLNSTRLECLSAVRLEVDGCCSNDDGPLLSLLFAVLLLYLADGFVECTGRSASTLSHHAGVLAILERLGGMDSILRTGPESLQMMLSEFASAELTAGMLHDKRPSVPPTTWDTIDQGSVWWGRDPMGRFSLATVFQEMSSMAHYLHATTSQNEKFSMVRVRQFEIALCPVYAPLTLQDLDSPDVAGHSAGTSEGELEAVHAFTLIRAFQHSALIYLYRALCGLPMMHPLVQQHVQSCLDSIFEIHRPSHVLNCVIFPLCVAGAHAQTERQRTAVLNMAKLIYADMRFASVNAVGSFFDAIWRCDSRELTWSELFAHLSPHALVL